IVLALTMACAHTTTAQQPREQPDMTIDAAARAEVIDGVLKKLNDAYVFPEVAKKMDPIPPETQSCEPSPAERERCQSFMKSINFGFEKLERLNGNVGSLDLRGFMDAEMGGDTVVAAMNFLANTDALIIDLRQNGGGSPAMVALISSYLFTQPTHLNDL